MPTVIEPKFASTSNCLIPELTCAKKHNPQVVQQHAIEEKEGILALDKYQADGFVSFDQFAVSTPGWLLKAMDKKVIIIVFMMKQSSMMQQLVLSGLKIK